MSVSKPSRADNKTKSLKATNISILVQGVFAGTAFVTAARGLSSAIIMLHVNKQIMNRDM